MKNIVIAVVAASALFGCASYQKKIVNLREKIECKVEVLLPYVDMLTDEQLEATLLGMDVTETLDFLDVAKSEIEKVKAELKACSK